MNSGATVRIASPEDLDCLITLILGFRDHGGHPLPTDDQLRDILPRVLAEQNTQFFLAADPDGDCLGYAQQRYRYSIWTQALQADIEDVFVVPSARRRGVAGALLQFAIECARTRGCQQISVDTNERNEEAVGFVREIRLLSRLAALEWPPGAPEAAPSSTRPGVVSSRSGFFALFLCSSS